jgi:SAM-dependent methyltransferase
MNVPAIDPFWEQEIYSQGHHLNRYPFDSVVSFIFHRKPRACPTAEIGVVEVGCGVGNNLWFAAREGFRVAGIDGSATAIAHARARFEREGLAGELVVGNFAELPWADESFDLAIDRCALTCAAPAVQHQAVAEVRRVLKPGGHFFFNAYSDRHTSARAGVKLADGRVGQIAGGSVMGAGALTFCSRADIAALFGPGWEIVTCEHLELADAMGERDGNRHTEWRVVVRKSSTPIAP